MYVCMYVKAVGNKGARFVPKCHLGSSVLPSKKTISPLTWQNPEVRTPLGSPLISLLSLCAAGTQIVTLSVPQLKVFDTSASSCYPSAAVTSSSSCRNPFAVR